MFPEKGLAEDDPSPLLAPISIWSKVCVPKSVSWSEKIDEPFTNADEVVPPVNADIKNMVFSDGLPPVPSAKILGNRCGYDRKDSRCRRKNNQPLPARGAGWF